MRKAILGSLLVLTYQQISLAKPEVRTSGGAGGSCAHPTVYYKPTVSPSASCSGGRSSITVVGGGGTRTVSLCASQARTLRIEGSGVIKEGGESYVVNSLGGSRFLRLSASEAKRCPYGYGVRQICLDPFSTVAADLNFYKPGDVLYFASLAGMPLPAGYQVNGSATHDGYVVVRDTGPKSTIKGPSRFDFFTGSLSDSSPQNPMVRKGFANRSKCFGFRKLSANEAAAVRSKRGYPNIKLTVAR